MPTPSQLKEEHRAKEKGATALATLALVATLLLYQVALDAPDGSFRGWVTGTAVGLCALISVRMTTRAAVHRWARETAAALEEQTRKAKS